MGRRSSLRKLPPEIANEVNRLLADGRFTLDEVVAHLRAMGVESVSRSALGRQKQKLEKVAARLRQSREAMEALTREFGPSFAEGEQGRRLVEILRAVTYDVLAAKMDGEDVDPKQIMALGRALKDMAQAARLDQDFEAKVAERIRREAEHRLDEAADKAAAESEGLTPQEALERVKAIYRGEA